jgi:quinol monooxygenase YgiN
MTHQTTITYSPLDPVWSIMYIEVEPKAAQPAIKLLEDFTRIAAEELLVIQLDLLLQEVPFKNQFALIIEFQSQAAYTCFQAQPYVKALLNALTPILISPIDSRLHNQLPDTRFACKSLVSNTIAAEQLWILMPIDIDPQFAPMVVTVLQNFARSLARDQLVIQYEVLQEQAPSDNHFTLIVILRSQEDYIQYVAQPYVRAFRTTLAPLVGSPPDVRLNHKLTVRFICQ